MRSTRTIRRMVASLLAGALCALLLARADASAPPLRYTRDASAGTVVDHATGLSWQLAVADGSYAQADAVAHCESSPLAGGGWRLPTVKELLTLVDITVASPAIDSAVFPGTPAEMFWTTTPQAVTSGGSYWTVSFDYGGTQARSTEMPFRARCVRWTD
jgi:Protein of unknown function (DUF1566)